jgi:hypothetical protein
VKWNNLPGIIALITLLPAVMAHADFAAGMKAYQTGNFRDAIEELLPLAKQGDAAAQTQTSLLVSEEMRRTTSFGIDRRCSRKVNRSALSVDGDLC